MHPRTYSFIGSERIVMAQQYILSIFHIYIKHPYFPLEYQGTESNQKYSADSIFECTCLLTSLKISQRVYLKRENRI